MWELFGEGGLGWVVSYGWILGWIGVFKCVSLGLFKGFVNCFIKLFIVKVGRIFLFVQ